MSAPSVVAIWNRALQKLGVKAVSSIDEDSRNARACATCYEQRRDALLRKHRWNFSILRTSIAADSPAPTWGRSNSFQLPSDCIMPLPPYPEENFIDRDWVIEGRKILTDESAPFYLRYVSRVTDVTQMDPLFQELLACDMAHEMCEELTQSTAKKQGLVDDMRVTIADAKKANAIEKVSGETPTDDWITARES